MTIKQNYLKVGLVLTSLTLLPVVHAAMAGDQVSYKGKEVGIITAVSFQFPFSVKSQTAEGEATQLGHYTLSEDFVVDVRFGTATGVATLTAANGDMLFLTVQGHVLATDPTKTIANFTVTGGTGRFEGATGSFGANIQHASAVGGAAPDPYVAEIEGTISTPGANKK
jgi:hypothetical protein